MELTASEESNDVLKPWKELTITMGFEHDVTVSLVAPSLQKLKNIFLENRENH